MPIGPGNSGKEMFQELRDHIQLVKCGDKELDTEMLKEFSFYGTPRLSLQESQGLAIELYQLLPSLREDPSPVNVLIQTLLEPWPLDVVLQIEPPVDFAAGLDLLAKPFHSLTLSLLEKGISDIASARRLATTQPEVFSALLKLWLCTDEAGVAEKAGLVIFGLLKADRELDGSGILPSAPDDPAGLATDNPIWRRIFRDPNVYRIFYAATDLKAKTGMTKNEKTIAQARLMEFIPRLAALDWKAALESHLPEVGAAYGLKSGQEGLIHFAAIHMVDVRGDVLLHRNLINYFADLLQNCSEPCSHSSASPALSFLIESGLHDRTMKIYVKPTDPSHDPLDITFLYPAAAHYVSTYTSICADHFLDSSPAVKAVLARLDEALNIPRSGWQNSPPSAADLHVLASVPREILFSSTGSLSPLLALPTRPANVDALNTLSTIFHGPELPGQSLTFPPQPTTQMPDSRLKTEAAAAQKLYAAYHAHNDSLWYDVVSTAETVAIKDAALAALNLVCAIATANWPAGAAVEPRNDDGGDAVMTGTSSTGPASSSLSLSPSHTGIKTLFSQPALTVVVPYLLRRPQQFANLIGGRGDAEGAAYKVATAKFDALKLVQRRLQAWLDDEGESEEVVARRSELARILDGIKERAKEGVWGGRGDIGGRIATLEL